ncbi:unnamed protein product [Trifolium pratense]|uniref:Uncharacterized protein n=1 Tax=Trifolium pratense TaxID=57577 RepID=A0ACB0L1U8_TRIPR|nr:unnamed protein product [Trifolium pratense]
MEMDKAISKSFTSLQINTKSNITKDSNQINKKKSSSSSNNKWLGFISCIPCFTSNKDLKKNICEGKEGNSSSTKHEYQSLEDIIFHDAKENIPISKETFEGESSSSRLKQSYCAICMEAKHVQEMFKNRKCTHSFCKDCVASYLVVKIQENIAKIKCPQPKCKVILEPQHCISIIPKDMFERWENATIENLVLGSQKFYCPFKDCSAMLVNDGKKVVTASECPICHRLFCAQCKVSWHAGVNCKEFRSLEVGERGAEDLMVMELAKNNNWKRCPNCSFYVERNKGCNRILCRCGNYFCYGCGSDWNYQTGNSPAEFPTKNENKSAVNVPAKFLQILCKTKPEKAISKRQIPNCCKEAARDCCKIKPEKAISN